MSNLQPLQQALGYGFKNKQLLEVALRHRSVGKDNNERLEFLGDGILEAITKFYLYKRFPKENEGFMTEKKIALVKNEAIGKLAYEMRINKWLIISKHAEEKKIRTVFSFLESLNIFSSPAPSQLFSLHQEVTIYFFPSSVIG